jgi:hypothetical protein
MVGLLALCSLQAQAQVPTLLGVSGGDEYSASPGGVFSINPATGSGTLLSTPIPGIGLTGIAVNGAGRVYAVTASSRLAQTGPRLLELNPVTGAVIADVGRLRTAGGDDCYIGDLSFQPGTNVLYGLLGNQGPAPRCGIGSSSVGGYLLTIDTATARVTVVGRDGNLGNSNGGIAFAPNGTLYFTPCWSNPGALLTLNPATAAIQSSVALLPSGSCYQGLAVRSDGAVFASFEAESSDSSIYIINAGTGVRTLVGSTGANMIHDLVFLGDAPSTEVPTLSEWATLALAALVAVTGFAWMRRRSRG